jgi:hypothetical protein
MSSEARVGSLSARALLHPRQKTAGRQIAEVRDRLIARLQHPRTQSIQRMTVVADLHCGATESGRRVRYAGLIWRGVDPET